MTGLLKKELYCYSLYKRNLLLILLIMVVFTVFFPVGAYYVPAMLLMFITISSFSTFTLDETAKWDRYAISMPFSRLQIVGARYIAFFFTILLCTVLSIGLGLIPILAGTYEEDLAGFVVNSGVISLAGLLYMAICAPLCYKFGPEKTRIVTMLISIALFISVTFFVDQFLLAVTVILSIPLWLLCTGLLLLVAGLYTASVALSVKIYSAKDY